MSDPSREELRRSIFHTIAEHRAPASLNAKPRHRKKAAQAVVLDAKWFNHLDKFDKTLSSAPREELQIVDDFFRAFAKLPLDDMQGVLARIENVQAEREGGQDAQG